MKKLEKQIISDIQNDGAAAFKKGKKISECPYSDYEIRTHWMIGYNRAKNQNFQFSKN